MKTDSTLSKLSGVMLLTHNNFCDTALSCIEAAVVGDVVISPSLCDWRKMVPCVRNASRLDTEGLTQNLTFSV